ncbi:hypothetical protein CspHIS471_0606790 [Cutaneotrichosporon sp. HIS471]|nr:hypothetical protein CspHIS471_0606790 [Cutaneotrichosporon sp. HIS471]
MVSSQPSPAPVRGCVSYPSADSYLPGDVGVTPAVNTEARLALPSAANNAPNGSPNSSATPSPAPPTSSTEDSDMNKEGGVAGGLRRLASRRRSTRDKEKGKEKDKAQELEAPEPLPKEPPVERKLSRQMTEREQSSMSLKNWWKSFKSRDQPPTERSFRRAPQTMNTRRVFGVPLSRVLTYAAMQISTSAPDGSLYVWGEVPILIGRCGAYLKSKTDIEGVFRVSGSAKRIRDLQVRFDEGPKYGIDLIWEESPYTPHDVATILRRYLTQMSEPVTPFQYYNAFRAIQVSDHTAEQKVREYKRLVRDMPRENQYLLLYLLDLLGLFARDSDKNLMTSANLAVIFQPAILSHPGHEMRPAESAISKDVVQFLIDHQAHFVFGMSKRMSNATRRSKSTAAEGSSKATPGTASRSPSDGAAIAASRASVPFITSPRPPAIPEDREASPHKSAPLPIQVLSPQPISPSTSSILAGQPLAHSPEPHSLSLPKSGTSPSLSQSPAPPSTAAFPVPLAATNSPQPSVPESRTSLTLQRPPPVRADTDFMLPSDSDEEAPPGGYYIVERATSPHRATSPFPPSPEPTGSVTHATVALQSILPPRPPRRSRDKDKDQVISPIVPSGPGVPTVDILQPSDSDDDAPAGGYVLFENKPGMLRTSAMGRAHSAAASPTARPSTSAETVPARSRTALQSGEGRANSPQPSAQGATGLLRRRTLPTKRVTDFTARMRRAVREA